MQKLTLGLALACVSMLPTYAQSDTTVKKPQSNRKLANSTSLELRYQSVNYTSYSAHGVRSYFVTYPLVSINGKNAVAVDKRGQILSRYFAKCAAAQHEINEMNRQRRLAKAYFWPSVGAGAAIMFSALAVDIQKSEAPFYIRAGIGSAVVMAGTYLAHRKIQKSKDHLHLSVDLYNESCYVGNPLDTTPRPVAKRDAKGRRIPSPKEELEESTVYYDLLRNEPEKSDMYGVALKFAELDFHPYHFNVNGGLGVFYTYRSLIGITADYSTAYVDHPNAQRNLRPASHIDVGMPTRYERAANLSIQTKVAVASWFPEVSYGLRLGAKKIGPAYADVVGSLNGKIQRSITMRAGYQADRRIIQNKNGINYLSNTPPLVYDMPNRSVTLEPNYWTMAQASAMLYSNIVSGGIGYSTFRDIKIQLHDETLLKRPEHRSQTDLYVDVLFATDMHLQDMVYYNDLGSDGFGLVPHRLDLSATPLSKMGARAGYTSTSMSGMTGWRVNGEAGLRPGIASEVKDKFYVKASIAFLFGGRKGPSTN